MAHYSFDNRREGVEGRVSVSKLLGRLIDWQLVGRLVGWLVGWLAGWLVG